MPATYDQARDEILAAFKAKWDADSPAIAGSVPVVFYDGVPKPDEPDPTKPYAVATIRHTTGSQASLADGTGRRRFEKLGIVVVAVFSPLAAAKGLDLGEQLAKVAKAAFEGKATTNGVWFRNARITEIGEDGPWFHWNVVAEFRYDEFV